MVEMELPEDNGFLAQVPPSVAVELAREMVSIVRPPTLKNAALG